MPRKFDTEASKRTGIRRKTPFSPTGSPPGTLIFRDDFETFYNSPVSPGWTATSGTNPNAAPVPPGRVFGTWQEGYNPSAGTSLLLQTAPTPGSGTKAVRAYLPGGTSGALQAIVVTHNYNFPPLPVEQYYGVMMFFPTGWRSEAQGATNWSFLSTLYLSYEPYIRGGGMVALYPYDNGVRNGMRLRVSSGYGAGAQAPTQYWNGPDHPDLVGTYTNTTGNDWRVIKENNLTKGVWHEIIVGIRLTVNNDGWYRAWWRPQGGTWTQTMNLTTGLPTVWWGVDQDGVSWTPAQYTAGGVPTHMWGPGLYRYQQNFPIEIWYDNIVRGDTWDIVAAQMPV